MITKDFLADKNLHFLKADNLQEVATAAVDIAPIYDQCTQEQCIKGFRSQYADWIGRRFHSFQEVAEALNSPWQEGINIYESMMEQLRGAHLTPPQSIKRRASWSEDNGDELCLDRLRVAQPYWRTTQRDHRPGPINVTMLTDVTTSVNVASKNILWRGAASTCLTSILEGSGYRVELWAVHFTRKTFFDNSSVGAAVNLKQPMDPLDVSTLINAVSGWAYRTLFLPMGAHFNKRIKQGHGRPGKIHNLVSLITPDMQTLICNNIWTEAAAVQWIKDQLEKFATGQFTTTV